MGAPTFPAALHGLGCRSNMGFRTPYPRSHFSALLNWESTPQSPSVLLCLDWHTFISLFIPDPPPFFQALSLVWKLLNPHRPSAALIWHSSFSFRTPATQHFPSGAPLVPGGWSPFSSDYIILPSKPQYRFAAKKHLITPVLAITNRAEGYWNSISAACQVRIISEYKERLQLLCCCDELCVPAFVTPDEMGEVVDDINTMFHRYHLTV